MFTANSMNCLCEALGMALPGNGSIPAPVSARIQFAKHSGMKVMELVEKNIRPRDIVTAEAFHNAITVDMALGCSTNTSLHIPAIAHEAGLTIDLKQFNEISEKNSQPVPFGTGGRTLHGGTGRGRRRVRRHEGAGGRGAVAHGAAYRHRLYRGENIAHADNRDPEVIRPLDKPYSATGGLAFLFGNIARNGCVVKRSAVAPEMRVHSCTARVFEGEEAAVKAIFGGEIRKGDIVVILYEGPKGGPGMREMLVPTSALAGMGLDKDVALITDGRFSGASRGVYRPCVPEAAAGGEIGLLRDGDIIDIDMDKYTINARVTDEEFACRRAEQKPHESWVKMAGWPVIREWYLPPTRRRCVKNKEERERRYI